MTALDAATPADVEGIAATHVACWREAYAGLMPAAVLDGLTIERRRRQWTTLLSGPGDDRFVRVVRDPGAGIVGFVLAHGPRGIDFADREIGALYLRAGWHGRGLGRALMQAACADAVARGAAAFGFWTLAGNVVARRFYEAGGAWPVTRRAEPFDDERIEEIGYRLPLPRPADGEGLASRR